MNVPSLYPVKTSNVLLVHPKRQLLIEKIRKSAGLEEAHFEILYLSLIHRYAEFVQAIPIQKGGKLGSLLDYGLVRSAIALQLYTEDPKKVTAAYVYAIFTIALMLDIGKVVSQQQVMISDNEGQFLKVWSPFSGSLEEEKAQYYKLRIADDRWTLLGQAATPLLARQLMPAVGFSLIAEDYSLLQKWLGILLGRGTAEGELLLNLLQLVDERLEAELLKLQLPPLPIESIQPEETALGEEFLAWLAESIGKGSIPINQPDAGIHMFETVGVMIDIKVFQLFCQRYAHRVDWLTVFRQFNQLGLTKKTSVDNNKPEQFYVTYPDNVVKNRMSYFLTGTQKTQNVTGQSGLPKIVQGAILTRPELLNLNVKQLPVSELKIQPVTPSSKSTQTTMKEEIVEYMERRSNPTTSSLKREGG